LITILDTKEVRIKDLNSTNGTFVNGKRISGEVSISATDQIKVGNATLDWLKHLNAPKENPAPPVFSGDNSAIKQKKTIGSLENNDIVLNYGNVSRNHAQLILKENGDILIADSGSTNGTYVNGQKISAQILQKGDRILIANKYPLDWESIFTPKPKPNKTLKTALISAAAMVAVAVVVVGIFLFHGGEKTLSAEEIYAKYKKSVVLIEFAYYYEVFLDGESLGYFAGIQKNTKGNLYAATSKSEQNAQFFDGSGTGFIVSNDGKIVTNRHIVVPWEYASGKEQEIKDFIQTYWEQRVIEAAVSEDLALLSKAGKVTVKGKMYNEYFGIYLNDTHKSQSSKIPCVVLKEGGKQEIDVGLIQIQSHTLPAGVKVENIVDLSNAVVEDKDIIAGDAVYLMGFPMGEALAATTSGIEADQQDGKITQTGDEYQFRHNAVSFGGASGSPVFNKYGKLIGVHHAGLSQLGAHGYNMAIKAKYAVELVK
jgi:pSer/pThr/pTyr-binding forkhead associated (FHA) protein/V8-like Glu-specific endopeptidase